MAATSEVHAHEVAYLACARRRAGRWLVQSGVARCPSRPQPVARPGPPLGVRHQRATCRVRPMLHRPTRPDRPTRRTDHARRGAGARLRRPRADRHQPGSPGLREALAACRAGDTLVVTKLDRLARSLPDARAIADELTTRQISLSLGGSVYDPTDAVGRLLFNVLAMVAEFESDLIRLRTVEGMKVAKAKGRLRGKQPKLNRKQEAHLVSLVHSGEYSTLEVAELFGVGRSTVYRAIERQRVAAKAGLAEASSRR
jgi:DNA invertase Pin-like site-specific DNA recombinase